MATVAIDHLTACRAYLLSVAAVTAQVGTRVYVTRVPANEASLMPRKAVTLTGAGGISGRGYNPIRNGRVDVRCFGATPFEAAAVYGAVYAALKFAARPTDNLINAIEESGRIDMEDPDTRWPFVLSVWQVKAYDTEEV